MVDISRILEIFKEDKRPEQDSVLVHRAFIFASLAHEGYKRISGKPYIVHPIDVATRLAEMHMPTNMIAAALLHDTIEDSNRDPELTRKELQREFSSDIVELVENVTKLDFKNPHTDKARLFGIDRYVENLRKMFVAFAKDVRAIIIKFADRIENLRDLEVLPPGKRTRIALETLEVYAPIAKRLGIAHFNVELEDLAFKHAFPEEYDRVTALVGGKHEMRAGYLDDVAKKTKERLDAAGIKSVVSLQARTKHFFSIYKKLLKYDWDVNRIWDIFAVRIIAENVPDCYAALGVIHSLWKPVKGRIKDYIAQPKPNGYRSIHTTVFCDNGEFVEFQIRTKEMHDEAQYGVAAHWRYDEGKGKKQKLPNKEINWVKELSSVQKEIENNNEFLETLERLKIDAFNDRIFVYTPKGDVIDLPEEATPVDFAYAIHTEIGNKTTGAIVNSKNVALNTPLKSGDVVQIVTDKNRKGPSADWLKFVKTNMARDHIKSNVRSPLSDFIGMIKTGKKRK
jgi:GTP diphosphokinase / guanosine-3',5'-bis(diphosphate) 3'-diphosphatase